MYTRPSFQRARLKVQQAGKIGGQICELSFFHTRGPTPTFSTSVGVILVPSPQKELLSRSPVRKSVSRASSSSSSSSHPWSLAFTVTLPGARQWILTHFINHLKHQAAMMCLGTHKHTFRNGIGFMVFSLTSGQPHSFSAAV